MKAKEIPQKLGLEEVRHYRMTSLDAPVIGSDLYTSLGKRLFELYQKYSVDQGDQREMENLAYLLINFTISREKPEVPKSFWQKWRGR